eukprot:Gregarina_sp_Poly_1__4710@NODE_2516_length_2040_cov_4_944247_g1598_i0_p2_GENE_NODE_2516_length_2040_cov_4_944247_g1598_i0NODE_2516_length_2040_cov_4_944247_g1598_i0_p2_ORF_typecomplete_len136_score13_62_NODE_2516_length_2040_cov_4_944247_g1598_i016311981
MAITIYFTLRLLFILAQVYPFDVWEHASGYDGYTPALIDLAQSILRYHVEELNFSENNVTSTEAAISWDGVKVDDATVDQFELDSIGEEAPTRGKDAKPGLVQNLINFFKRVARYH